MDRFQLLHYTDDRGHDLFEEWLDSLRDTQTIARIAARLTRLSNGNFGDCKTLGEGVREIRIHWGPGWRVYYGVANGKVIVLCAGGTKNGQQRDIALARYRWQDWMKRNAQ